MRLFVAVELPDDWRHLARDVRADLESRLSSGARSALRWVDLDLLHLTLRFLGEFPDAQVETLQLALSREIGDVAVELESDGLGGFGGRHRMQVVWLGVRGEIEGLRALAQRVERACVATGARPESRPSAPHVTLARVRERAAASVCREVTAAVEATPAPLAIPLRVSGVALIRSTLGAGAPRYDRLSRHPAIAE